MDKEEKILKMEELLKKIPLEWKDIKIEFNNYINKIKKENNNG